tara:strand:+ start:49474 stop:49926 length:453 start_codon:yes stop_codon:yes gene_type:complete
MSKKYIFAIDTDKYAGNFEREMCAYATGQLGICEVGKEMQKLFIQEEDDPAYDESLIFEGIIENRADGNGAMRPCSIGVTPNLKKPVCNSVEIYFHKKPTEEQIEMLKRRCTKFATDKSIPKKWPSQEYPDKILGFRLITEETTLTEEKV